MDEFLEAYKFLFYRDKDNSIRDCYWTFTKTNMWMSKAKLTDDLIKECLDGIKTFGVNQFITKNTVFYGKRDYDTHSDNKEQKEKEIEIAFDDAKKDIEELKSRGYVYGRDFIVHSSGSSGMHLHFFCNSPVDSKLMRNFLDCIAIKTGSKETNWEVFPKQDNLIYPEDVEDYDSLDEEQKKRSVKLYGNQTKMCLSTHPKKCKKCLIYSDENLKELLNLKESKDLILNIYNNRDKIKQPELLDEDKQLIQKEVEKKESFNKKNINIQKTNGKNFCPSYCVSLEKISMGGFPRGMHQHIDKNMFIYANRGVNSTKDVLTQHMLNNGREYSAFNGNDKNDFFNCGSIRNYLSNNKTNELCKETLKKCSMCKIFKNYLLNKYKDIDDIFSKEDIEIFIKDIENENIPIEELKNKLDLILKSLSQYEDLFVLSIVNKINKLLDDYTKSDLQKIIIQHKQEIINNAIEKQKIDNDEDLDKDVFEVFADNFIKKYPCYYDNSKILFTYNKEENKWIKSDERDLVNIAKNIMGKSGLNNAKIRTSFTNAILDKARWHKPIDVPIEWVHFNDCFYDIKEDERIEANQKYFSQIKIPHNLGLSIETPIIDDMIKSWVCNGILSQKENEMQYKKFIELCAYCMYKGYPFARFFIFYGTGSDGKSTAGEFISRLIGIDNACTVDIDQLSTQRFEAQKLYQKTLAICGEVDYKILKNTRKLKGVTGGDPITIEFKNKDPFQYKNFAKLIWYANGVPPTYDKTQGFYRRTNIIKFPNKFTKEKVNPLNIIPEYEYENFCFKCLKYLQKILDKGMTEDSLEQKTQDYEELSNPVLKFCNLHIEKEKTEDYFILMSNLFDKYLVYAKQNSYRSFSFNDFCAMVKAEDYEVIKIKLNQRKDNGEYDRYKDPLVDYEDKDIRRQAIIGCKLLDNPELKGIQGTKGTQI